MKPSNVLFILSDEHRRDALGCYGHKQVRTPHLDALANRGVRFESAYTTCPICVPARASLATGRYVHETGYWDNAFPYEGRVRGWGHKLIDQGYRVESVGKLHYRSELDDVGFGVSTIPLNVVDGVGDPRGSIRDRPPVRQGTRESILQAGPGTSSYLAYDEEVAMRTCKWLQEASSGKTDQPWVLYSSFVCPHPPYIAPGDLYDLYPLDHIDLPVQNLTNQRPEHAWLKQLRCFLQYDDPFTEEQIRRVAAAYYGACTHLDLQIGKVLDTLRQCGLEDQTRVIYTSDHGENLGDRGLWGKFTMYEESIGVPMLIAGPDIPKGEVNAELVSHVDVFPSIISAVGAKVDPADSTLPGDSLFAVASGQITGRTAFCEYHALGSSSACYMVRDQRYKLIYYVGYPCQLFDLVADPLETMNLADDPDHCDTIHRLEQLLRDRLDPEEVDQLARRDQEALIERLGGRDAVLGRGTFINSPIPGEKPRITGQH